MSLNVLSFHGYRANHALASNLGACLLEVIAQGNLVFKVHAASAIKRTQYLFRFVFQKVMLAVGVNVGFCTVWFPANELGFKEEIFNHLYDFVHGKTRLVVFIRLRSLLSKVLVDVWQAEQVCTPSAFLIDDFRFDFNYKSADLANKSFMQVRG